MKIVYVLTCLDYGGAELQVVRLAKMMAKRHHEIMVITLIRPKAFINELEADKIKVISLNMEKRKSNALAFIKLMKHIKSFKPDIVHSHMYHANILARLSRVAINSPKLINTIHGIEEVKGHRPLIYRLTNFLSNITTTISINTSEYIVNSRAVRKQKLIVIYNGVDTSIFKYNHEARIQIRKKLDYKDNMFVWISVGRFEKPKDHKNLINAFKIVVDNNPNVKLLLIGDGSLKLEIEKLVIDSNIKYNVIFLGLKDDVNKWLSISDGYVMSSEWEGMPLVLQEASSVGVPIVATFVGGNNEVVIEGKNGYLVKAKNSKELALGMIKLMNMKSEEYSEFSEYGKNHVRKEFDMKSVTETWVSLYAKMLGDKL